MSESIKSDVQPQELNITSTPDEAVNAATTEFTEQNSINEETPQVSAEDAAIETEVARPASRQEIIERLQAIAESDDALNSKAEVEALKVQFYRTRTAEIEAAVKSAQDILQAQIDDINEEIDDIKDRLAALEGKVGNLIDRIQSIRFLPEYSDGKVELTSDNAPVTLTFLLSPNEAAQAIATAYVSNKSVVTAYLSLTQERTRAVGTPTQINVTKVTGTADGVLTVEVNAENLPADYWATAENANLFIRISDGNNDVISEMIPAFYREIVACYLPSGSTFYTAVNTFLTSNASLTQIKFIADPRWNPESDQIEESGAYMVANGTTLEIRTDAEVFMFHADCKEMFVGRVGWDDTKLASIVSIDFNNFCLNNKP